jgi:hypothetical protein
MIAFEVFINTHRICLAGVGNDGVLNAIVNWVGRSDSVGDIFLKVGALDTSAYEFLRWHVPSIGVGAEILVRVVEANSVDLPDERFREQRPTALEEYRAILQQFTEQLTKDERQQLLKELITDLQDGGG